MRWKRVTGVLQLGPETGSVNHLWADLVRRTSLKQVKKDLLVVGVFPSKKRRVITNMNYNNNTKRKKRKTNSKIPDFSSVNL